MDELLAARKGGQDVDYQPHSIETAANMLPDASWVIVSVAGRYAGGVTREALRLGKESVAKWLEGCELIKEIYVPNKLINLVVK